MLSILQMHNFNKEDAERGGEREVDRANEGYSTPDYSPENTERLKKINYHHLLEKKEELRTIEEENFKMKNQQKDLQLEIDRFKKNEEILSNEIRVIVAKERKLAKINFALKEKEESWKIREDNLEQEIWLLKKMVVLHSNEKRLAIVAASNGTESTSTSSCHSPVILKHSHSLSPLASPRTPKAPPGIGSLLSLRPSHCYIRPSGSCGSRGISPINKRINSMSSTGSLTSGEVIERNSHDDGINLLSDINIDMNSNKNLNINTNINLHNIVINKQRDRDRESEKDRNRDRLSTKDEERERIWEKEKILLKAEAAEKEKEKEKEKL